jgi:HlyD family secretion protein
MISPRQFLILLVFAGLCSASDNLAPSKQGFQPQAFKLAEPKVIRAIGTVEPEDVADVGAQVSGVIQELGAFDYGSNVKKGSVLARLDRTNYKAEVAKAESALKRAQANLKVAKSKAILAERELDRVKKRTDDKRADDSDLEVAKAAAAVAKDEILVEEAAVEQAKAVLDAALAQVDYTTIVSPIGGVIIDRRCTVGQTVSSRSDAPSLFLIAKDLKRMTVWTSVKEADIRNVSVGQAVTFTTDAHPGETFKGKVTQVRLNATIQGKEGVVYTVVVATDNGDLKLLPYLTAEVSIEVGDK